MLRGVLAGRRAIARGAQIAAFAASATMAFSVTPAAEPQSTGARGPARARHDRGRPRSGLSQQSPAQRAALGRARDRRERADRALRLPAARHRYSSLTDQYLDNLQKSGTHPAADAGALPLEIAKSSAAVSTAGLTTTQTLFNGFQTANRTRQAEGQVFSAREPLRSTEQTTLLNAATAYMNLAARRRHPRTSAQQRERPRGDAAADARPLQRRRGDAHRRGAGGIAPGRRPLPACR